MRKLSFEAANDEEGLLFEVPPSKPRGSFHRSSSSSLTSALSFVNPRRSFSYDKLAQIPIHLTVVKLDASSFEIDVTKMATIYDLKQAVESAFSHLPTKGPGKVSWRHVWAHFCLCYCGRKLLNDREYIKDYGIKDGDELRFIRHVSIAYNLIKKRSRKRIAAPKLCTIPENYKEERQKVEEAHDVLEGLRSQVEDNSCHDESLVAHLFRGWFLYSRLSSSQHLTLDGHAGSSRWAGGFVGCLRSIFHFCDHRPTRYSSRVSRVEI